MRVMVVSRDDGVAVEIQISGAGSLLPGMARGHVLDSVPFLPLLETSDFQELCKSPFRFAEVGDFGRCGAGEKSGGR